MNPPGEADRVATSSAAIARAVESPRRARGLSSGKSLDVLFWLTAIGLVAFNGWWFYRDFRPLLETKEIENTVWPKMLDGKGKPIPLKAGEMPRPVRERLPKAERDLREALRRSPNDGEARILLARVLEAKGDILGCALELHEVPDWWPKKLLSLESEAIGWKNLHRARPAIEAWERCVSPDPDHPPSLDLFDRAANALLNFYIYEERWEEARGLIWKYYQIGSPNDHPIILGMRIRLENERVSPEKVAEFLAPFVAADPRDFDALRALARAEQSIGRSTEAMEHARAGLAGLPDDPRSWIVALKVAFELGEVASLTDWANHAPTRPETFRYAGRPRDETPILTAADNAFAAEIHYYRGLAFEQAANWSAAAEEYRQAVRLRPYREEYHFKLAGVEQILGRTDSARVHRERNLSLRAARKKLRDAYADYIDASRASQAAGHATPKLLDAIQRLADSCRDLNFPRAADAWKRLLPESE